MKRFKIFEVFVVLLFCGHFLSYNVKDTWEIELLIGESINSKVFKDTSQAFAGLEEELGAFNLLRSIPNKVAINSETLDYLLNDSNKIRYLSRLMSSGYTESEIERIFQFKDESSDMSSKGKEIELNELITTKLLSYVDIEEIN